MTTWDAGVAGALPSDPFVCGWIDMKRWSAVPLLLVLVAACPPDARAGEPLARIRVGADGRSFVRGEHDARWVAWGVNYDHDGQGRLLEEYWADEWQTVVEDLREIRDMGFNAVRIHLQFGRLMQAPNVPNEENLARLDRLIKEAADLGLYLDITGLGCYHRQDVPPWYDELPEDGRWAAQAGFWRAVAGVAGRHPNVFCYDLMNEPILPGGEPASDWLAGELGGKFFVQRLTLDLTGRPRPEVARAWVAQQAAAIRGVDADTLLTVGVIPWAHTFPKAKPLFYAPGVGDPLDVVSVHFYPKAGEIERAVEALRVYDVGKPLVVEEMFPLACSIDEMHRFIDETEGFVAGYFSFYWGTTIEELEREQTLAAGITAAWLRSLRARAAARATRDP
jgi:hypothetical protein